MIHLPAGYRERCNQTRTMLDVVRAQHMATWQECAEFILPMRTRFMLGDKNKAKRSSSRIVDGTPIQAVRTLKAGMQSYVTPPTRPWFALTTPDPDLADFAPVKDYLYASAQVVRDLLLKSNLYAKLPLVYQDMGVFGTSAMTSEEDPEDNILFRHLPLGTYWIATDDRERVDTLIRETSFTARQLARRFGDKISPTVRSKIDSGQGEAEIQVIQHIARNEDMVPSATGAAGMGWMSVWYELTAPGDAILGVEGFHEFPAFVPRWETNGDDTWGFGPGLEALPDVKALMAYEIKAAKGLDKELDPSLMGPASMRQSKVSLLPGDITWLPDAAMAAGGLKPIHQVQFRIDLAEAKSAQIRQRISRCFFEDLFLTLSNLDRRQMTAHEVEMRRQESLLGLGPVLHGIKDGLLDPLIDRTFAIASRRGLLPEPPEEIQGVDLKVEYTSVLAAAQRSVDLGSTRAFVSFATEAAQLNPAVLDKVDLDEVMDEVANQLGTNPRMVRSTDDAQKVRQGRAQAQDQAQQAAMLQQQAATAKDLAQIPANQDTALTRLAGPA
jgi:hypothetical protein